MCIMWIASTGGMFDADCTGPGRISSLFPTGPHSRLAAACLPQEHDEVVRLREQLSAVTAERDRLLQELGEGATPRVFDMEDACALRGPFH